MAIESLQIASYTDLQGLASLKREARAQSPEALREAARQFETVFTRMMLQSMRQASTGDSLFDSQESGFYRDMFDDQLSVEMSRGKGLGLADMLVEQLLRSGVVPGAAPAGKAEGAPPAAATGNRANAVGGSPEAFVEKMFPEMERAGRALGVSPRTLLAHAALETGWGASMPAGPDGKASFNLFGIKATGGWQGEAVGSRTLEFEAGVATARVERFRAYANPQESVGDYVSLLSRNPRYAAALGTGEDTGAFATALQRGGYATDPRYAEKLSAVAETVGKFLDGRLKGGNSLPIQSPHGEA